MSTHAHHPQGSQEAGRADRPQLASAERPPAPHDRSFQIATTDRERHLLKRAAQAGAIQRVDRGLYLVNPGAYGPHHELAAVAIRRPDAIICLESAAAFHGLTSAPPAAVQFGIPRSTHAPRWQWPAIEPITLNLDPSIGGIETQQLEGVPVKITSPARTVAESLRHIDRLGMHQFQEILWSAWRKKLPSTDEIVGFADKLGIADQMKVYLTTVQGA